MNVQFYSPLDKEIEPVGRFSWTNDLLTFVEKHFNHMVLNFIIESLRLAMVYEVDMIKVVNSLKKLYFIHLPFIFVMLEAMLS